MWRLIGDWGTDCFHGKGPSMMQGMNVFSGGPCLKHIFQDVQCTYSRMNDVSGEIFVERNPPLRPAPAISNLMRSWNASLVNRTSHDTPMALIQLYM